MNQLIEQLKQNAGIDFNPDQEGLDLFAELIVKECARLIETRDPRNDPTEHLHLLKAFGILK